MRCELCRYSTSSGGGWRSSQAWGRLASFALAGAIAVGAAAVPAAPAMAATDHRPVTITFWNWWDGERATFMKTVIEHFHEQYPWITVDSKVQGWTGVQAKIMSAFAAGVAPEVMMAPRNQILALADMGAIIPLTKYIQRDKVDLSMFYPAEVDAFRYAGQQWTLPLPTVTANDDFYFYNKDAFDQAGLDPNHPPETWTSFEEVGLKLNRRDGSGKYTQLFVNPGPHMYLDFLFSNGGYPVSSDLRHEAISSLRSKEALNYLYELGAKVAGPQAGPFMASNPNAFLKGKLVTLFENVSLVRSLVDMAAQGQPLNWSVGLIPYNEKNPDARSTGVAARGFGWGYVIPKGLPPEKEEAAWLWIKFLTTDKYGTGYFSFMMGRPSPVKYWNQNPDYRKVNPAFDRILAAMETDRALPAIPVVGDITDAIVNNLWGVAAGTASPVDAGNNIAKQVQNILDKYWAKAGR
ncbi:MAG: extracellular solute-binding protein [Limnochordaceae bacterium]|nr:extracellular solute-binding protein [Limnochordaceae bacterium]